MRKYLSIGNNFVKVEFDHFWSRKALTMLKHMEVFVERKTGLKRGTIATFDDYFLKNVATMSKTGDIHYEEKWEDTRGLDIMKIDYQNNPPPLKLAWVLDLTCTDGIYSYGYLGFSIEPGFGFSFKQGLKNPKAIKQRPWKEEEEDEDEDGESEDNDNEKRVEEHGKDPEWGLDKGSAEGCGLDDLASLPTDLADAGSGIADGSKADKSVKPRARRTRTVLTPSLPKDEIEKALDDLSKMIETNSILLP